MNFCRFVSLRQLVIGRSAASLRKTNLAQSVSIPLEYGVVYQQGGDLRVYFENFAGLKSGLSPVWFIKLSEAEGHECEGQTQQLSDVTEEKQKRGENCEASCEP